MRKVLFFFAVLLFSSQYGYSQCVPCEGDVLVIPVDLTANPDTIWTTSSSRSGLCCGHTGAGVNCIRFDVSLHPDADQFQFTVTAPAPPSFPGSFYQINCGDTLELGVPVCISGTTDFCLVFCKSGGDSPTYTISTSQSFATSSDISVNYGCTGEMTVEGLLESSITWTSIFPGAVGDYDSYLGCTAMCDSTTVSPDLGFPPFVDYLVSGSPTGCDAGTITDTIRVYFNDGVSVEITPDPVFICDGDPDATITAIASGGSPPYSYLWSTGGTSSSITVGPGTYWVQVSDTTTGCPPVTDTIVVTAAAGPIVAFAGGDTTVCITTPDVTLAGTIDVALGGVWSGGSGTFTPNDSSLTATYTPTAGEIASGSVTLTLTSYGNGGCPGDSDDMTIFFQETPVVDAGGDAAICEGETVTLSGSVTGGAGTGIWTSSGTGTFAPSDTDLGATYTPSAADVISGTVTITLTATDACAVVFDDMVITITPAIIVDAGADAVICEGDVVSLTGSVTGGSVTGTWTSSGTGTFSPSTTSLTATYTPSAADIAAGTVTITLTSTGGGACAPVADDLIVTITDLATVDAGSDIDVCEGESIILSGTVTGGSGTGLWTSSGTGTFSPSATDLGAEYIPSPADIAAGTVTITLSADPSCSAVTDDLIVTITAAIIVDAGADVVICEGDVVSLVGSVTGGSVTGTWTSSGTGTFSPSTTSLTATYTPSAADIAAGTVTITLTSTGGGACAPVADDLIVTITDLATVDAGSDIDVCEGESIILSGTVTGGSGTGLWTSSGTGTFSPSATDLGAEYIPSPADIAAGTVTITLSADPSCSPVTDDLIVTITAAIIVDAGPDQLICEGDDVTLAGSVTGGTVTGIWTTLGSGTFSPSATTLAGTYTPSAADIAAGTVTLILTSTASGACTPVTDTMIVTIEDIPTVDAGSDIAICEGDVASLSGTVTGGSGTGLWTSSGTGTFSPSDTDLGASYVPSAADILAGTVTLTLSADPSCFPVSDVITLTITQSIIVDAGTDTLICIGDAANLAGSVTGGTTTGIWTTLGSGTFAPSASDLGADYTPSGADETAGTVTLVLTSTASGACSPVTDTVVITIKELPTVDAGGDVDICEGDVVTLSGTITGDDGTGFWTTSGTGTFSPSATDLGATYTPSAADVLAGSVTITLTADPSCALVTDDMIINITPAIIVDAGLNDTICVGDIADLSGSVTGGAATGIWTSSGTGTFTPSDTDLGADYIPSAADELAGTITITLTSTGGGVCADVSDDIIIVITEAPFVDAGLDVTICSNDTASLAGVVSGASVTGMWSSSGDGTFIPSATDLGASYIPGPGDEAAGSVTLYLESTFSCLVVDSLEVTIVLGPNADAGPDQVICLTDTEVFLSGIVSGITTTGIWSTSGTGTFTPSDTDLGATYNLTPADSAAGTFFLILTSTDNGVCPADIDTMMVTMTTIPVVDAGVDTTFCENNMGSLAGTVTGGASTGIWTTSGSGTFIPSDTSMTATYDPSAADIAAGTVTLTLTSTGACVDISDDVIITITPGPVVDAGNDTTICNFDVVLLSGSVSGASTTGIWSSSGDGTFLPTDTDLNATYAPGPADIAAGTFDIYLDATAIGDCLPEQDTLTVTLDSLPVVDGGGNQTICSDSDVSLSGSVSGGYGGSWSTLGTGTFAGGGLSTTYFPSIADTTFGEVTLILTSGVAPCGVATDTVIVFFIDIPEVEAGEDIVVCANNDTVSLAGMTTSGEGVWSTGGDGLFTPDDSLVTTMYVPGASDESGGSVVLYLSTINTVGCPDVSDSLTVTITPAPLVDAGPDLSTCVTDLTVTLSGSVSGGSSTGIWSSDGTGTFIPDNTSLTTDYELSVDDTTAGVVTIVLTSTLNGDCLAETDTLLITIDDFPTIEAGEDQIVCQNDSAFFEAIVPPGGSIEWMTNGTGVFVDSSANPAAYLASLDDTLVPIQIWAVYTNACGTVSDTLTLTVLPSPNLSIGYVVDCETFEVQFEAITTSGTLDSVFWDLGDGSTDTTMNPFHTYPDFGTYPVTVEVTTIEGCGDFASLTLTIDTLPIADFLVSDTIVGIGDIIEFIDTSSYEVSWEWDFGDLTGPFYVEDTTHSYGAAGEYTVVLTVANISGCIDSAWVVIVVEDDGVKPPAIPNAFTPNGDGLNDVLYVRGGPFEEFDFRVYNEWGNRIFYSGDQSEGWDGTYRGKEQPGGIYVILFEGKDIEGNEYSISIDVSLIR